MSETIEIKFDTPDVAAMFATQPPVAPLVSNPESRHPTPSTRTDETPKNEGPKPKTVGDSWSDVVQAIKEGLHEANLPLSQTLNGLRPFINAADKIAHAVKSQAPSSTPHGSGTPLPGRPLPSIQPAPVESVTSPASSSLTQGATSGIASQFAAPAVSSVTQAPVASTATSAGTAAATESGVIATAIGVASNPVTIAFAATAGAVIAGGVALKKAFETAVGEVQRVSQFNDKLDAAVAQNEIRRERADIDRARRLQESGGDRLTELSGRVEEAQARVMTEMYVTLNNLLNLLSPFIAATVPLLQSMEGAMRAQNGILELVQETEDAGKKALIEIARYINEKLAKQLEEILDEMKNGKGDQFAEDFFKQFSTNVNAPFSDPMQGRLEALGRVPPRPQNPGRR